MIAVAERLGHKNATLVLKTYGHLMADSEDRTRKAVETAWAEKPDGPTTAQLILVRREAVLTCGFTALDLRCRSRGRTRRGAAAGAARRFPSTACSRSTSRSGRG